MLYRTELGHAIIVESSANVALPWTGPCHQEAHGLVLGEDQHVSVQRRAVCATWKLDSQPCWPWGQRFQHGRDNRLHRGKNWCQGWPQLSWLDCRP